jgi:hypothetical protein
METQAADEDGPQSGATRDKIGEVPSVDPGLLGVVGPFFFQFDDFS